MRAVRTLLVLLIAGSLVIAFVLDREPRPIDDPGASTTVGSPVVGEGPGIWFCPGGSSANGPAAVSLELVNAGVEASRATVTGIRSGSGEEARTTEVVVDPGARLDVRIAELVPDSAWMGAFVEVDGGDTVVEQTVLGDAGGLDVMTCLTESSTSWIVASGATRAIEFGEQMVILLLNPFLDDAIVDIDFDSDVGVQSLPAVVVPARRVVAVDVTEAVTVAARVSATIDVRAGRVVASRIQLVADDEGSGLTSTPAAPPAPVWYLPVVHRGIRDDVITVVNPSPDRDAQVDLEILADGEVPFEPILLTVRPGRTARVALADEDRLDGVERFAVVARSLDGVPVGVMLESRRRLDEASVSNVAATPGGDVLSDRWIAPLETDTGSVVILNPSSDTIATATVAVAEAGAQREVTTVELSPGRWAEIGAAEIGGERPIVVVEASQPVVVGRVVAGVSSYALPAAVAAGTVVTAD